MKKVCYFFLLFSSTFGMAQHADVERFWTQNSATTHSDVKLKNFYALDSIKKDSSSLISISGLPEFLGAYQHDQLKVKAGADLVFQGNWKDKIQLLANYRVGYTNQGNIPYEALMQAKAIINKTLSGNSLFYNDIRGRIAYTPNQYLQLQAGVDQLFIGEGDRSLLLGNQGVANPFIQARARLWKLEYHFIQQILRESSAGHFVPKGNATHYLSFKPSKKLTIGLFETVVYSIKDTLYNRGFELEYLNPLVFYRPQEYNMGSADNVILGMNISRQWKKNMLYGQVVIDDFFLAEMKARNRWWANKFGVQFGFKTWIDRGETHYFVRSELNIVRPFTYSQVNQNVVYGNQGFALAHPLGSNFAEFYQEVMWQKNAWRVQSWALFYVKGIDTLHSSVSYGGDIYKPYNNRPEEYHFTIGRGITTHVFQVGTHVSHTVFKQKMSAFVEPRWIRVNSEGSITTNFWITVGLQRRFGMDRRNY